MRAVPSFLKDVFKRWCPSAMSPSKCRPHNDKNTLLKSGTTSAINELALIAYRIGPSTPMRLVPAPSGRAWMHATVDHFAERCLPLLIANQSGWWVLNSHPLRFTWSGGSDMASITIEHLGGLPPYPAVSHFGHGILTWHVPYLFCTPPGYNLLVRGPSNWPKDGVSPLEGIVETDWTVATFTMNWKLTRPNQPVTVEVDEPICMLVPQRRGELESFHPRVLGIETEPEVRRRFQLWSESRARFLHELKTPLKTPGSEAVRRVWQKHYFQGKSPDCVDAPEHQTKLRLRDFSP